MLPNTTCSAKLYLSARPQGGKSECGAALHAAARPKGGNTYSVLRTAGEVQPRATPEKRMIPPGGWATSGRTML